MNKKSLNFEFWRFCIDPEDEGLDQQWQFQDNQPYLEDKDRICVPSCWNRKTFGKYNDYQGVAWFWRVFRVPKEFHEKKTYLKISRMAHEATVFIDGEKIGNFKGGFIPFKFDISKITTGEDHFIAIRVDGRESANRYVQPDDSMADLMVLDTQKDKNKQSESDINNESLIEEYYGLFGEVSLETEELLVLDDISMDTKLHFEADGEALNYAELIFSLYVKNNSSEEYNGEVNIELSRDYVSVAEISRDIHILDNNSRLAKIVLHVDVGTEDLWTIEDPTVFNLSIKVGNEDGTPIELHEITGIRQLEYKEDKVFMNGEEIPKKGGILPIEHPQYGYSLPISFIQDKLGLLKKQGVNIIRPNQGTFTPLIIEMASRLGILVIEDIPVIELSLAEKQTYFKEYVNNLAFQPSIILWSVHPSLNKLAEEDPNIHKMIMAMEETFNSRLDPTRFFVYKGNLGIEEWEFISRSL